MKSLAGALVLWAAIGAAHADNKDVARDAFREGTRQYDLGDFKAALDAFKRAYLHYEDAAFLYNIAQCQRQLGDKAEALRSYRVYLRKVPGSSVRAQVDKVIDELQAAVDQERAAKAAPPTGTVESTLAAAPPSAPDAQPSGAATRLTAPAPERKPITRRGWFWGVLAGGAVVVAGGVALAVVLGTRHPSPIELVY